MSQLDPVRRVRRWHTYLVVWRLHRVLGVGLAALIVLMSTSGFLLVLHHEVERWLGPPYRLESGAPPQAEPASWNSLLREIESLAPEGYRAYRLMPGKADDEPMKFLFIGPDGRTRWAAFADPGKSAILWHGPDQALFTPWLLNLHMHLHLGPWGYSITGLAGLALLLLGLTGLYLHRYDLAFLWKRPPFRVTRGWRVFLHDTHTWIGTLSIYFSVVLGATGLAFAILIMPGQLKAPPAPPPKFDLRQLAAIAPMTTAAEAAIPGHEWIRVSFPTAADAPLRILLLDRSAPVWAKFSTVAFNASTGEVEQVSPGREATTARKWRAIVSPLHFGLYGAGWVKVLYAIGGLAPAVLAITGVALWWRRTRRARRAGPGYSGLN